MKTIRAMAIICLVSMAGINLHAASITVFPADLRQDKSVHCIGNEINPVHFILFSDRACGGKPGRYLIKDFNKEIESARLTFSVDVPKKIEYLGIVDMRDNEFDSEAETELLKIDGKEYVRHTISLKRDLIISRVVKGRYRYDINLWLHTPEEYQGEIRWRLLKNGKPLVAAQTGIKTVGTLDGMTANPSKKFKFYLTYPEPNLPVEIMDRRIALYKKMGITDVTFNYSNSKFSEYRVAYIKKLKSAGIKINFQRSGSFSRERHLLQKALSGKSSHGLYSAAQQCYEDITDDTNRNMLEPLKEYMDGYILDYEQHGAVTHPAYDDKETVAAFAKEEGLDSIPTLAELKGKYHADYLKFRDRLIMKPIYAVAALLKSVKPGTTFYMEQGSGVPVGNKLDYKLYDDVVSYHLPMIYTKPLDFYHRSGLMADYVGKGRVVPVTCAGFTDNNNKVLSHSQTGELLMDYVGAASQGLAGIKHWPGGFYLDGGQMFEFCQGADLLNKAGDFYTDGKADDTIKVSGIPYLAKVIKIPGKTLDMSQPQWKNYLMSTVTRKGDDRLITLLNYHSSEDAYVRIKWKQTEALYLKEVRSGKYLSVDGSVLLSADAITDGVIVKVPFMNPGLWVLSPDKPSAGYKTIAEEGIINEFEKRKLAFNKKKAVIQIGQKGKIDIGYRNVEAKTGDETCLMISTPSQSVYIKNTGGIIWRWDVNGKDLVPRENIQDGVAMDLLWVPETARWGGDEINEMRLMKCENSGAMATLVYEQQLKSSLPNIVLRKTYHIPANKALVDVEVELINRTEQPQEMSYWSHNIFGRTGMNSRVFMIARNGTVESVPYGTGKGGAYSNIRNAEKLSKYLIKKARNNFADNVFGEYFADDKIGVILTVPADYMQIYRWTGKGKGSLEWMGTPQDIATGDSYTTRYTIRAVSADDADEFKEVIQQTAATKRVAKEKETTPVDDSKLLVLPLNFTFTKSKSMPDGYSILRNCDDGAITADDKVFVGKSGPSLRFDCPENGHIGITTGKQRRLKLEVGKKYILTFQFKIENMKTFGKWPSGFVFYLLGASKSYAWIGASGKGSTDGWVTAVMPFDTGKKPAMAHPYIRILCNNISGTIWLQNASIIEMTDETMPKQRYFISGDGKQITASRLKL